tara:strand:- start:6 stop:818 length:813 start_codon:yes stop_codon:yes gene_type:complete
MINIKKFFMFHYYKERFNRLFDFCLDRSIKINLSKEKSIIFFDAGKKSALRSRSLLFKEKSTLKWIDGFEVGSKFIDIGASIGTFSLYAAVTKSCEVVAIEPSSSNFNILNINISKNKLNDKIIAYPLIMSDENKLEKFFQNNISIDENGGNPFRPIDARENKYNPKHVQGSITYRIDKLISETFMPDYLKIDIDGNEIFLIEAMKQVIKSEKIKSIMIELDENGKDYKDIVNFFLNHNYILDNELTNIADRSKKHNHCLYNHYFNLNKL